jgi:hypothetical protein
MEDNGEDLEGSGPSDEEPEDSGDDSEDDALVREKNGLNRPRDNI